MRTDKYVLYDLDEARRYSITTGFGLQFARIGGSSAVTDLSDPGGAPGVTPRVSLALSRLNLFGRGQTLTLQGVLSTLQKRAVLTYFVPKIFNLPEVRRHIFDSVRQHIRRENLPVQTRQKRTVKLTQHVSKPITIFYDFTYRQVGVSDLKIDPLLVPQLAQSVRVGIAEVNFIQDRRDDPLDAHKGIYNTIDVGLATKAFGSQTSFVRVLARNATYHPLGSKLVLARETQVGLQPAFAIPANYGAGRSDPARGALFCGRRQHAARVSGESGGPARPADRLPAGRLGDVFQQHGTAVSAVRREYQRRAV